MKQDKYGPVYEFRDRVKYDPDSFARFGLSSDSIQALKGSFAKRGLFPEMEYKITRASDPMPVAEGRTAQTVNLCFGQEIIKGISTLILVPAA